MKYECSWITHTGFVRMNNEDALTVKETNGRYLLAVADGMGGHACGEVASNTIIKHLESYSDFILRSATASELERTLAIVLNKAISDCRKIITERPECVGMGTTLVLSVILDEKVFIYHIGDSRAYHIRTNRVEFVTKDHTVAQELLDKGLITKETFKYDPRKHILTKCIGGFSFEELQVSLEYEKMLLPADKVLLCSDGLIDMVDTEVILEIVNQETKSVQERAEMLLNAALSAGGIDNVSIILLEVQE